jgi:hypothetical protein
MRSPRNGSKAIVAAGRMLCAYLITAFMAAAPPLTLIQDVLYKADGTPFSGLVVIEWKTFEASDSSLIARNRVQQRVSNGLLSVRLVPTTTSGSSAYYSVKYISSTGTAQFTEAWAVRPSATPLRVTDIRIPDPLLGPTATSGTGGTGENVEIDQVTGLRGELDIRPKQAPGYMPDRVAVITTAGELGAVVGSLTDCIRVDGTSAPCGIGGAVFVDLETPSGTVNGSNANFTLSISPNPGGSLMLYVNGVLHRAVNDYTLSGASIQFQPSRIPAAGSVLMASYRISGASAEFVDTEVPNGSVNGSNATFALSQAPLPAASLLLHRNGLLQKNGLDYTLSGNTVQFLSVSLPQVGDTLLASYRTSQ